MQNIENKISTCLFLVCLADKNAGGKAQISGGSHPALVCRNLPGPAKSGAQPNGAAQGGTGMQARGFDGQRGSEKQGYWGDPAFAENLLGSLATLKKEKNLPQSKGRERISWRNPCWYCILRVKTVGCISKSPAAQKNISSIPGRCAAFSGNLILRSTTEDRERRRRDGMLASPSPAARCDSKASQLSGPPSMGEDVFLALAAGLQRTSNCRQLLGMPR